jgi:Zn-dependent peptidase ImmA (M78 family)
MIKLARQAARAAMKMRSELGYQSDSGICPFDIAEQLGLSVRLIGANSLEGLYFPPNQIVVGALRPPARQRFTCAHELGHHRFGHGDCIASADDGENTTNEYLANRFASALLMPKLAVLSAFRRYGADPGNPDPLTVWRVAQSLGVGYETLVNHMHLILEAFGRQSRDQLLKTSLAKLRSQAAGFPVSSGNVWAVDSVWGHRSVDIVTGDILRVPSGYNVKGDDVFVPVAKYPSVFEAKQPGEASVATTGHQIVASIRVASTSFEGLARYRFLPLEADDE